MAGDAVWLEVLPELSQFGRLLGTGTEKAAGDAGKRAGGAFSSLFDRAVGTGVADDQVKDLEKAAKAGEKAVEQATAGIAKARAAQREAAAKTAEAEAKLADSISKYGEESKQAEAAALRLEAAQEREGEAARKTETAVKGLKAAHEQAAGSAKELADATKDSADKGEKSGGVWDGLKGKLGGVATAGVGKMVGALGGLAAAAGASMTVADQLGKAWEQALEKSGGTANITASLGLDEGQAKQAGDAASGLFGDGFGESMTDVTASVESVMSTISGLRDASSADIEAVTSKAMGMASAFDIDVSEAARNAGILMKTGLAPDATAAFDLMTAALQQVPEAMRGEVMDAGQEYSQFFAQLGFSGEESMGMLVKAAEGGQYQIDKTGDALKEFSIRSTNMSASSVAAYETLGLNAKDMSDKILAGGDSAKQGFDQIVDGLLGIEDPTTRANTAIALFGTPLEDLGTDQIPEFLAGLQSTEGGLGDVGGKAQEVADTMSGSVDPIESLKRSLTTTIADGLEPFVEPAQKIADWAKEHPGVVQGVAIALGVLAGAFTLAAVAVGVFMLVSSPITLTVALIAAGVALLVAGIVALAMNWDTIWGAIKSFFVDTVAPAITGAFEAIGKWFSDLGVKAQEMKDAVVGKVTELKDRVVGAFTEWRDQAGAKVQEWKDNAVTKATELRDNTSARVGEARDWVTERLEGLRANAADKLGQWKDNALTRATELRDGADSRMGEARDWVTGKLDGLRQNGIDKFQNLKDGALGLLGNLRDDAEARAKAMVDLMGKAWDLLPGRWKQPVIDLINWLNSHLIGGVNKLADKVGLGKTWIPDIPVPKLATGGPVPGYSPTSTSDNIPALLTADEHVIRQPSARRMRRENPGALEWINRYGTLPGTGGLSYEDGVRAGASLRLATGGRVFPLPAGTYRQTQGLHGVDGGYDYAAPIGTRVMANADATVVQARTLSGSYGRYVRLSNGSVYAHLNSYSVSPGQQVRAGQVIGTLGWSGNVRPPGPAGAHLHYVPGGALGSAINAGLMGALDIGAMFRDQLGDIAGKAKDLMAGAGPWGQVLAAIPGKVAAAALGTLKDKAMAGLDTVASVASTAASTPLKLLAQSMLASRGWSQHWPALEKLVQGESSWNPLAKNPSSGAYGLPQALPGSKMSSAGWDWRTNPATQLRWMLDHHIPAMGYGNPTGAYMKWLSRSPHWYDRGGELPTGLTVAYNGTGQTEAVLTAGQWDTASAAIREVAAPDSRRGGMTVEHVDMHVAVSADDLDDVRDTVELFERLGFEARLQTVES